MALLLLLPHIDQCLAKVEKSFQSTSAAIVPSTMAAVRFDGERLPNIECLSEKGVDPLQKGKNANETGSSLKGGPGLSLAAVEVWLVNRRILSHLRGVWV